MFPLTIQLFELATSPAKYTTIQFVPSGNDIVHHTDEICDIGIPKKVYLRLFSEGHDFLDGNYKNYRDSNLPETELYQAYLATISLMSTTNEHTTAWNVHREVFNELRSQNTSDFFDKELRFCMALVTSKLDRINKSSMLWHWIRTLVADANLDHYWVTDQILRSMEMHFANYSAGYTLCWYVARNPDIDIGKVLEQLRSRCRKALGDISLWAAMGKLLQNFQNQVQNSTAQRQEDQNPDNQFKHNSKNSFSFEAESELQWLLSARCTVMSPYVHVTRCLSSAKVAEIVEQHRSENFNETLDKITNLIN